jgi:hypothetical protein
MTLLEKIKSKGGFADFGAIGSMPLGYYFDGEIMSTTDYYNAKKLVASKDLKLIGTIGNGGYRAYLTHKSLTGEHYN